MWATTKYVSCWIKSAGGEACIIPDNPPMMKMLMKPTEYSIGVLKLTAPRCIVAIQLKIFTPVGTAISIVVDAKTASASGPRPTANMWWAHTPNARNPNVDDGHQEVERGRQRRYTEH